MGCIEGGGDGAGGRPVALDRDGERQEGEEPNSARAAAIYDHGRRRTESGRRRGGGRRRPDSVLRRP